MTALEIVLLVGGAALFVLSFVVPTKKQEASEEVRAMIEEEVKKKVTEETEGIKKHVDTVVDDTVTAAQEKTERSLERMSNEKIMAVQEYSDTVLEEINKNHKEVMFLYDMLNDKHDSLVSAVNEANQVINETKESTQLASEAAYAVKSSTKEAVDTVNSFRAMSPEYSSVPEFDISQVLKYSQNPVVNLPHISIEAEMPETTEMPGEATYSPMAEGVYGAESVSDSKVSAETTEKTVAASENKATVQPEEKADGDVNAVKAEDKQPNDKSKNGGKVRTLKWAEAAEKQADEVMSSDAAGTIGGMVSEEERAIVQDAVIKLHEAGKSDVEIARSLDMGVGEVSLIIGLHNNNK